MSNRLALSSSILVAAALTALVACSTPIAPSPADATDVPATENGAGVGE